MSSESGKSPPPSAPRVRRTPEEARRFDLAAGQPLPEKLAARLARCAYAPIEDLLERGVISSGEMLAEDKVMGGGFVSSAAEARGEMEQLKLDQGFLDAYLNRDHVGHKAAVSRMRRLSEAAWPEPRR